MRSNLLFALLALIAVFVVAPESFAVVVGGHDFDGGLTAATYSTSPVDPGLNGLFSSSGSRFDRWGVVNRVTVDSDGPGPQGLPFDVVDESADPNSVVFQTDQLGIYKSFETDNKFLVADLENSFNPGGTGFATWTFNITGQSNLQFSVDMAALGRFNGDVFQFIAQVDAGTPQLLFDINPVSGEQYLFTNEFGTVYDRYSDGFWDATNESAWAMLIDPNTTVPFAFAGNTYNWSNFDADMDGFDDVSLEKALRETNTFGTFEEAERYLWIGPLGVVPAGGDPNNPVRLNNDFQTLSAPILGTGTTLTITMTATQNGGFEFFTFDNLLVESVAPANADFDGSGFVDGLDFLKWQRGETPGGGSAAELALWEIQYGGPPPLSAISAVPEPASVALLGLGLALAPWVCRRRARSRD